MLKISTRCRLISAVCFSPVYSIFANFITGLQAGFTIGAVMNATIHPGKGGLLGYCIVSRGLVGNYVRENSGRRTAKR